jgi:hypothetical protein
MPRIALALIALLLTSVAVAANPHFLDRQTSSLLNSNGSLTVAWFETGLGNNQNINYALTTDALAVYACLNNGGNFPKDPKKFDQQGTIIGTGTFNSGQNGNIQESLTVGPPVPPTPNACKGNQELLLLSVSYTNIRLTDLTNAIFTTAPNRSAIYLTP